MKHYISLLMLLTGLLLGSCSLLDEGPLPECPAPAPEGTIQLSFRLLSPGDEGIPSRADSQGHNEVDSDLQSLEDGIDFSDLAIYVFAADATGSDDRLLFLISDFTDAARKADIAGFPGEYRVSLTIPRSDLATHIGREINPSANGKIRFRVVMAANCAPVGVTSPWPAATTFTGLIDALSTWKYQMDWLYTATAGPDAVSLYSNKKKHLPMWGSNELTVADAVLADPRPWNVINMGDVDMLRSLAKIRVVDNIKNRGAEGYPRVAAASITGLQSSAMTLPANAASYTNGLQVHIANIADPESNTKSTYRLGTIPTDEKMLLGFIPEQNVENINGDSGFPTPVFKITVALSRAADGTETLKDYTVGLKTDDNAPILRNHIYTLSVESVKLDNLTLEVAVNEWKTLNFEYEY